MKMIAYLSIAVAALVLSATGRCEEPEEHIGMALLKFEIHQNGKKVHTFQAGIRDGATLSDRWDLLLEEDLPASLAAADKSGNGTLSGAVEIRMNHAGTLVSKAILEKPRLAPGNKAGTWKVKEVELQRIKKAAQAHDELPTPLVPAAEWEMEFCKTLMGNGSFQFCGKPLIECLEWLHLSNTIVDPPLAQLEITLRVEGTSRVNGLMSILRASDANWELRDGALFIFKNEYCLKAPPPPPTADETERLKRILPKLSSEEFEARDAAMNEIRELGSGVLTVLKAEKGSVEDPDALARIDTLINAIMLNSMIRMHPIPDETPEAAKLLSDPIFAKKISFKFADKPMAKGVEFLKSLAPLPVTVEHETEYPPISLDVTEMDASNALRWVVRLGGGKLVAENGVLKVVPASEALQSEPRR